MGISKRNLCLILGVVLVAVAAHWVTVAVGQPPTDKAEQAEKPEGPLVRWLDLSGDAAKAVDEEGATFHRDIRRLERQVQIETLKLASLIEDDATTDEALKAQFDAISKAQVAVHQRIAAHVLAVRPHLSAEQRARFNEMLVRHFRAKGGPGGPGHHRGGPEGRGPQGRGPMGPGMRGPEGRGPMGPGMRGPEGRGPMGPAVQGPEGRGPMGPGMHGPEGRGPMGPGMRGPEGRGPMGPGMHGPGPGGPRQGPGKGPREGHGGRPGPQAPGPVGPPVEQEQE